MRQTASRRQVLTLGLTGLVSLLAGCVPDYATGRELYVQDIRAARVDSGWEFTVTVTSNDNTERGGFANVSVVGYTAEGTALCEQRIGDMMGDTMTVRETVTLNCKSFPRVIAPTVADSSCSEDTYVDVRVYDDTTDVWTSGEIQCGASITDIIERT